MLSDILTDAGYGVLEAADGFEALRQLRQTRPDLIILDLMLAGMSGWQFLEHSHKQLERANIPVVILSAIRGGGDYPTALGVAAWLNKPVDIEQFLSAVESMAGPAHPVRRSSTSSTKDDSASAHPRVLVIEDEQPIRDLIVEHLREEGFVTAGVETIEDADLVIAQQRPSLVVLDLMLPGSSGFDFLAKRGRDPTLASIPVLVISAAPQSRLLEAKELGADAFLSKPFDFDALTALVRSFVY